VHVVSLTTRTLEDLNVFVPINGWKLQELVGSESVGQAVLRREPAEFLSFGNDNVLEQCARNVAMREVMDGYTNAISDCVIVAFGCRNMFALRGPEGRS